MASIAVIRSISHAALCIALHRIEAFESNATAGYLATTRKNGLRQVGGGGGFK